MLDKLVESKSKKIENRRIRKFFVSIGTVMTGLFVFGLIASIFSTNLAMSAEGFDITRLVAPTALPTNEPAPQPEMEPEKRVKAEKSSGVPERAVNMKRIDENPSSPPTNVSVVKNTHRARPNTGFRVTGRDIDVDVPRNSSSTTASNSSGAGVFTEAGNKGSEIRTPKKEKPPAIKKAPPALKPTGPVHTGIVNGRAINLVKPRYSAAAKQMGVKGTVKVRVLISESGRVISANAIEGHPLLKGDSERAAKRSTFTPTTVSGQAVKVRGVIVYNFN